MSGLTARYAVCQGVLRQGSFADDVAMVAAAGIAGIGVDANVVDEMGPEEARRILTGEGVGVSSYMDLAAILQENGSTSSLEEAARRLDIAAGIGAPTALVTTGPLRTMDPSLADSRCRDWLARAAVLARERGLLITLEPVHPLLRRWSYVHTLDHARRLVEGIEAAALVVDVGHLWWERDLQEQISKHIEVVATVQLTNVDSAALEEVRYERAPLEEGDVPVAKLVRHLEAVGYGGWYENEVLARIPRQERLEMLRASREWMDSIAT